MVVEGVALPLVHTAWVTAVVFTVLNACLLACPDPRREHARCATLATGRVIDCSTWSSAAGPAGLATAIYAARAGLEVGGLEPRPGPIDKACGEGLMPGAVRALADAGR